MKGGIFFISGKEQGLLLVKSVYKTKKDRSVGQNLDAFCMGVFDSML